MIFVYFQTTAYNLFHLARFMQWHLLPHVVWLACPRCTGVLTDSLLHLELPTWFFTLSCTHQWNGWVFWTRGLAL